MQIILGQNQITKLYFFYSSIQQTTLKEIVLFIIVVKNTQNSVKFQQINVCQHNCRYVHTTLCKHDKTKSKGLTKV